MVEHDFERYPELTNKQIEEFGFMSPHPQITEDFDAMVEKVHDGDTITLSTPFRDFDFPLRFLGIDSKELNEGGEEAREWMKSRILKQMVRIQINRQNRVGKYGRLLGKVFHGGLDVGEEELQRGLATKFTQRGEHKLPNLDKELSIKQWL